MFNVSVSQFDSGVLHLRYFPNHLISHEPIHKKKPDVVETPFVDENGNPCYATLMPTEEELALKAEESKRCSMSRTRARIRDIALSSNRWKYFCTFTFDGARVDRYDYSACCVYMKQFLKDFRRDFPTAQYIIVPELHKDGAFHFHGLFSEELPVTYVGYFRKTGHTYHINGYCIGYNTATIVKSQERVSRYIAKYITKDLCAVSKNKRRYWFSFSTINVAKPYHFMVQYSQFILLYEILIQMKAWGVYYDKEVIFPFYDIYVSSEAFDYILDFFDGYESDDICYSFSDD